MHLLMINIYRYLASQEFTFTPCNIWRTLSCLRPRFERGSKPHKKTFIMLSKSRGCVAFTTPSCIRPQVRWKDLDHWSLNSELSPSNINYARFFIYNNWPRLERGIDTTLSHRPKASNCEALRQQACWRLGSLFFKLTSTLTSMDKLLRAPSHIERFIRIISRRFMTWHRLERGSTPHGNSNMSFWEHQMTTRPPVLPSTQYWGEDYGAQFSAVHYDSGS